ncbi:MAG: GNAT family N-acetyltransferase [Lachnospirales bacterium]
MSNVFLEKVNIFHSTQINEIYNYNLSRNRFFLGVEEKNLDDTVAFINTYLDSLAYPFFVLKSQNKILGYGYLSRISTNKIFKNTCNIDVLLAEGCTGYGFKKILCDELEIAGKICGISKLIINILDKDTKSISFYRELGYNIAGRVTDACYKRNKYMSLVIMEKDIR